MYGDYDVPGLVDPFLLHARDVFNTEDPEQKNIVEKMQALLRRRRCFSELQSAPLRQLITTGHSAAPPPAQSQLQQQLQGNLAGKSFNFNNSSNVFPSATMLGFKTGAEGAGGNDSFDPSLMSPTEDRSDSMLRMTPTDRMTHSFTGESMWSAAPPAAPPVAAVGPPAASAVRFESVLAPIDYETELITHSIRSNGVYAMVTMCSRDRASQTKAMGTTSTTASGTLPQILTIFDDWNAIPVSRIPLMGTCEDWNSGALDEYVPGASGGMGDDEDGGANKKDKVKKEGVKSAFAKLKNAVTGKGAEKTSGKRKSADQEALGDWSSIPGATGTSGTRQRGMSFVEKTGAHRGPSVGSSGGGADGREDPENIDISARMVAGIMGKQQSFFHQQAMHLKRHTFNIDPNDAVRSLHLDPMGRCCIVCFTSGASISFRIRSVPQNRERAGDYASNEQRPGERHARFADTTDEWMEGGADGGTDGAEDSTRPIRFDLTFSQELTGLSYAFVVESVCWCPHNTLEHSTGDVLLGSYRGGVILACRIENRGGIVGLRKLFQFPHPYSRYPIHSIAFLYSEADRRIIVLVAQDCKLFCFASAKGVIHGAIEAAFENYTTTTSTRGRSQTTLGGMSVFPTTSPAPVSAVGGGAGAALQHELNNYIHLDPASTAHQHNARADAINGGLRGKAMEERFGALFSRESSGTSGGRSTSSFAYGSNTRNTSASPGTVKSNSASYDPVFASSKVEILQPPADVNASFTRSQQARSSKTTPFTHNRDSAASSSQFPFRTAEQRSRTAARDRVQRNLRGVAPQSTLGFDRRADEAAADGDSLHDGVVNAFPTLFVWQYEDLIVQGELLTAVDDAASVAAMNRSLETAAQLDPVSANTVATVGFDAGVSGGAGDGVGRRTSADHRSRSMLSLRSGHGSPLYNEESATGKQHFGNSHAGGGGSVPQFMRETPGMMRTTFASVPAVLFHHFPPLQSTFRRHRQNTTFEMSPRARGNRGMNRSVSQPAATTASGGGGFGGQSHSSKSQGGNVRGATTGRAGNQPVCLPLGVFSVVNLQDTFDGMVQLRRRKNKFLSVASDASKEKSPVDHTALEWPPTYTVIARYPNEGTGTSASSGGGGGLDASLKEPSAARAAGVDVMDLGYAFHRASMQAAVAMTSSDEGGKTARGMFPGMMKGMDDPDKTPRFTAGKKPVPNDPSKVMDVDAVMAMVSSEENERELILAVEVTHYFTIVTTNKYLYVISHIAVLPLPWNAIQLMNHTALQRKMNLDNTALMLQRTRDLAAGSSSASHGGSGETASAATGRGGSQPSATRKRIASSLLPGTTLPSGLKGIQRISLIRGMRRKTDDLDVGTGAGVGPSSPKFSTAGSTATRFDVQEEGCTPAHQFLVFSSAGMQKATVKRNMEPCIAQLLNAATQDYWVVETKEEQQAQHRMLMTSTLPVHCKPLAVAKQQYINTASSISSSSTLGGGLDRTVSNTSIGSGGFLLGPSVGSRMDPGINRQNQGSQQLAPVPFLCSFLYFTECLQDIEPPSAAKGKGGSGASGISGKSTLHSTTGTVFAASHRGSYGGVSTMQSSVRVTSAQMAAARLSPPTRPMSSLVRSPLASPGGGAAAAPIDPGTASRIIANVVGTTRESYMYYSQRMYGVYSSVHYSSLHPLPGSFIDAMFFERDHFFELAMRMSQCEGRYRRHAAKTKEESGDRKGRHTTGGELGLLRSTRHSYATWLWSEHRFLEAAAQFAHTGPSGMDVVLLELSHGTGATPYEPVILLILARLELFRDSTTGMMDKHILVTCLLTWLIVLLLDRCNVLDSFATKERRHNIRLQQKKHQQNRKQDIENASSPTSNKPNASAHSPTFLPWGTATRSAAFRNLKLNDPRGETEEMCRAFKDYYYTYYDAAHAGGQIRTRSMLHRRPSSMRSASTATHPSFLEHEETKDSLFLKNALFNYPFAAEDVAGEEDLNAESEAPGFTGEADAKSDRCLAALLTFFEHTASAETAREGWLTNLVEQEEDVYRHAFAGQLLRGAQTALIRGAHDGEPGTVLVNESFRRVGLNEAPGQPERAASKGGNAFRNTLRGSVSNSGGRGKGGVGSGSPEIRSRSNTVPPAAQLQRGGSVPHGQATFLSMQIQRRRERRLRRQYRLMCPRQLLMYLCQQYGFYIDWQVLSTALSEMASFEELCLVHFFFFFARSFGSEETFQQHGWTMRSASGAVPALPPPALLWTTPAPPLPLHLPFASLLTKATHRTIVEQHEEVLDFLLLRQHSLEALDYLITFCVAPDGSGGSRDDSYSSSSPGGQDSPHSRIDQQGSRKRRRTYKDLWIKVSTALLPICPCRLIRKAWIEKESSSPLQPRDVMPILCRYNKQMNESTRIANGDAREIVQETYAFVEFEKEYRSTKESAREAAEDSAASTDYLKSATSRNGESWGPGPAGQSAQQSWSRFHTPGAATNRTGGSGAAAAAQQTTAVTRVRESYRERWKKIYTGVSSLWTFEEREPVEEHMGVEYLRHVIATTRTTDPTVHNLLLWFMVTQDCEDVYGQKARGGSSSEGSRIGGVRVPQGPGADPWNLDQSSPLSKTWNNSVGTLGTSTDRDGYNSAMTTPTTLFRPQPDGGGPSAFATRGHAIGPQTVLDRAHEIDLCQFICDSKYVDLGLALRLCYQFKRLRAWAVAHFCMGNWMDAVTVALLGGYDDLAVLLIKSIHGSNSNSIVPDACTGVTQAPLGSGSRTVEDQSSSSFSSTLNLKLHSRCTVSHTEAVDIRQELWKRVIISVAKQPHGGPTRALRMIAASEGDVNVSHVLPHLSQMVIIREFKRELKESVKSFGTLVSGVQQQINDSNRDVKTLKRDVDVVRRRKFTVDTQKKCDVCEQLLLTKEMVLFPGCGHVFHRSCYNHRLQVVLETQQRMEREKRLAGRKQAQQENLSVRPSAQDDVEGTKGRANEGAFEGLSTTRLLALLPSSPFDTLMQLTRRQPTQNAGGTSNTQENRKDASGGEGAVNSEGDDSEAASDPSSGVTEGNMGCCLCSVRFLRHLLTAPLSVGIEGERITLPM